MRQNVNTASLISFYRLLLISTSIAIVAVLAYSILPERSERLLPNRASNHFLFADGQSVGKTRAEWIDEKRFAFKCIGRLEGNVTWPFCGLKVVLGEPPNGLDLSGYDRLEVKLRYTGNNKRIRIFMHNFNPAYAKADNWDSFKPLDVELLPEELTDVISIYTHEWRTSTTWIIDRKVPRHLYYPEFNNIIDFGVDLVSPVVDGEHIVEIDYIDLYGKLITPEKWYLGIALLWLVTTLLFVARHLIRLQRRIHRDEARLSSLAYYSNVLKKESEKYKELSNVDPLTGALNRNGLANHMSASAPDGKLLANTALLMLDIDHFKKVNDTKGHDVGDEVLKQVAKYVHANIRSVDCFVRWGGEEFIVFLVNTRENEAFSVAEKIRIGVEELQITHHAETINVTISIGVGVSKSKENFDELFHSTDQALYKAKNLGRNIVVMAEH